MIKHIKIINLAVVNPYSIIIYSRRNYPGLTCFKDQPGLTPRF